MHKFSKLLKNAAIHIFYLAKALCHVKGKTQFFKQKKMKDNGSIVIQIVYISDPF